MTEAQLITAYCVQACNGDPEALALLAGTKARSINYWLLGDHDPRFESVSRLASAIGQPLVTVLQETESQRQELSHYIQKRKRAAEAKWSRVVRSR